MFKWPICSMLPPSSSITNSCSVGLPNFGGRNPLRLVTNASFPPGKGHGLSSSREELAQLIGTTPETLSRTLHGLADEGVLALDRKTIRVLDLPSLLKRAE
jgi:CRP-like cAMP-binding protein